jgi:hypothetical protein
VLFAWRFGVGFGKIGVIAQAVSRSEKRLQLFFGSADLMDFIYQNGRGTLAMPRHRDEIPVQPS